MPIGSLQGNALAITLVGYDTPSRACATICTARGASHLHSTISDEEPVRPEQAKLKTGRLSIPVVVSMRQTRQAGMGDTMEDGEKISG